jgi:uncharacterized membrane protein
VLVNVPINEQIAGWDPRALPVEYEAVLGQWWRWHLVRVVTSAGAMFAVLLALLARDDASVVRRG